MSTTTDVPTPITTPDTVQTSIGTLEPRDEAPTAETAEYFGPQAPAGKEHNWLQTNPDKGWFVILRLYSPLQPFFDKSWRPSEIAPHDPDST